MDCSPPGSSVHGTVARQAPQSLEFARQEYWSGLPFPSPGDLPNLGIELMSLMSPALAGGFFTTAAAAAKSLQSCLTFCDPTDCSLQAPLSMEFSRQEYWSGLPFPSPEDLPDPGIKPGSPALQGFFTI